MFRFLLPLGIIALAIMPVSARADAPTVHTVAWGETLYSIARLYGIAPQLVASANGIGVNRWVYAGERLTIPSGANELYTAMTPTSYYTVRAGDTLYSVASRFNVSADALASTNDLPANGLIYVGSSLKIPSRSTSASASGGSAEAGSVLSYIVQPGDSLPTIALRYGTTVQAIAIANNLPNFWFIIVGQRLIIPQPSAPRVAPMASALSMSEIRVSDIPLYRQLQTLTCEEAAVSMATRGAVSERQLLDVLPRSDNPFVGIRGKTNSQYYGGLTDYGVYAQPLQRALTALGLNPQVLYRQAYDDFKNSIIEQLRAGRAIVWWNTWHERYARPVWVKTANGASVELVPYEHVGVIVAANDRGIAYHDPYDATIRFASWADHRRVSGYFDNMALVIQ